MSQPLALILIQAGFLILLWLFVLIAVRVIRTDLFGRPSRATAGGTARAPAASAPRREKRSRASAARRLIVTDGALAGTSITLGEAPVTLGRSDGSTLVLTDDYASNQHARLMPGQGAWYVEDLGSTNGTYLGQQKVSRPTPVPLGVPIRIGRTTLELRK